MFIQPWDAALSGTEWRDWLAGTDRFGTLVVNNRDPQQAPLAVPTHFTLGEDGTHLLVHLARPNPVWPHLEAAVEVRLVATGDYAFIPGYWRAAPEVPETHGVPTSYYASVQFVCRPTVVDDPEGKAAVLRQQMADFQPEGRHGDVDAADGPYARMLPGIRAVRLDVVTLEAKFKYDDHKPLELRHRVNEELEDRGRGLDHDAAKQQRRRIAEAGDWETRRSTR